MPRVIGLGDMTTTGGVVIECHDDVQLNNQGTTTIGMKATCPKCQVGVGPIMAMKKINVFIEGIQVAVEGDWVQCGCPPKANTLIGAPASYIVADDQSGVSSMKMPFMSPEHAEQAYQNINSVLESGNLSFTDIFNAAQALDDWKPVPGYRGVIYHTKRQMDDYSADDLQCGDMSMGAIMRLGEAYNFAFGADAFAYPASVHFGILRAAVQMVSLGEYGGIIGRLIGHFEKSTGSTYSEELLDKAMREHVTTKAFTQRIQTLIGQRLTAGDGVLSPDDREAVQAGVNSSVSLPKFDTLADWVNGLGIAVHDVYAVRVELTKLEFKDREFRGVLTYKVQDHFGLDDLDVDGGKKFEYLAPFRSWFLLQRYSRYAYKPFITEMNFTAEIKGSF